jgi:predicted phage gp36 major capsid-like protein
MFKKWQSVSVTTVLSAALLLGITAAPYAANLNNGKATTETHVVVEAPVQTTTPTTTGNTAKPAEAPKKQKSVFDADALQSPFSFLKDAVGGSDEEDKDVAAKSSMVVLALKALAATLLSTIM